MDEFARGSAPLNPSRPRSIELSIPSLARLIAIAKAGAALVIVAAICLSIYSAPNLQGGIGPGVRLPLGLLLFLVLMFKRHSQTGLNKTARIIVDEDNVIIEHPGVLQKREVVPLSEVKVVTVDARPAGFNPNKDERFALAASLHSPSMPSWLYSGMTGSPLPLVGSVIDTPNFAVLLKSPHKLSAAKNRPLRAFASKSPTHLLTPKSTIRGVVARAKNPAHVKKAFEGRAPVRPLSTGDVETIAPDEQQHSKAVKQKRKVNAQLCLLIAFQLGFPVWAAQAGGSVATEPMPIVADPSGEALGSSSVDWTCETAKTLSQARMRPRPEPTNPGPLETRVPPSWDHRSRSEITNLKAFAAHKLGSREGLGQMVRLARDNGFKSLSLYEWRYAHRSGSKKAAAVIRVGIASYGSIDGAQAMHKVEASNTCRDASQTWVPRGIENSLGLGNPSAQAVMFARGHRHFVVSVRAPKLPPHKTVIDRVARTTDPLSN